MAELYRGKHGSTFCQYLLGFVLLIHTSAVHLTRLDLDQNRTSEFVTLGEFKFCKRANSSYTFPTKCNAGKLYAPEYKRPSLTAMMSTIIQGVQWTMGMNDDWRSACFVTTQFEAEDVPCTCKNGNHPEPMAVFYHAWLRLMQHTSEAITFLTYVQNDVYVRGQVLDGITSRAMDLNNFDQVVFLGTGFDTRPYRHGAGMAKAPKIFETDLKITLDRKRTILNKCGIGPLKGESQIDYMNLNLLEEEPFKELWHHNNFTANGQTLFVAEQVFPYLDVFGNMHWLRELRDSAVNAGGNATLVLMATRGPNFDMSTFPRCYDKDECLLNQMPLEKRKANSFMRALGWAKSHGYVDLENRYRNAHMSWRDSGYVGVFHTDSSAV